ncbi:MAG TPA: 16S rRNA (cytosine(1402)-N(4))-methyltransferase, partial [Pyrinomonadaceae bacterium]|nr:16S rRNA (cytosine(1402)-N(4))-methyltransferase [Pyrinomonadaceae bacterium]
KFLEAAAKILSPGGRILIISFHSLEDRIIKNFFKCKSGVCICENKMFGCKCGAERIFELINRKVITPGESEILNNPRARSAKLRAAVKIVEDSQDSRDNKF